MSRAEIKDLLAKEDFLGEKFRRFWCETCSLQYRANKLDSDRVCPACSIGDTDECNS